MRKALLAISFLLTVPQLAQAMPLSAALTSAAKGVVRKDEARRSAEQRAHERKFERTAKELSAYVKSALGRPELQRLFAAGEDIPVGQRPFRLSAKGFVSLNGNRPVTYAQAAEHLLPYSEWKEYLDEEIAGRSHRMDVMDKVEELTKSRDFQRALKSLSDYADPHALPMVSLPGDVKLSVRGLTLRGAAITAKDMREMHHAQFTNFTPESVERLAFEVLKSGSRR